jgi:hypothetical protein
MLIVCIVYMAIFVSSCSMEADTGKNSFSDYRGAVFHPHNDAYGWAFLLDEMDNPVYIVDRLLVFGDTLEQEIKQIPNNLDTNDSDGEQDSIPVQYSIRNVTTSAFIWNGGHWVRHDFKNFYGHTGPASVWKDAQQRVWVTILDDNTVQYYRLQNLEWQLMGSYAYTDPINFPDKGTYNYWSDLMDNLNLFMAPRPAMYTEQNITFLKATKDTIMLYHGEDSLRVNADSLWIKESYPVHSSCVKNTCLHLVLYTTIVTPQVSFWDVAQDPYEQLRLYIIQESQQTILKTYDVLNPFVDIDKLQLLTADSLGVPEVQGLVYNYWENIWSVFTWNIMESPYITDITELQNLRPIQGTSGLDSLSDLQIEQSSCIQVRNHQAQGLYYERFCPDSTDSATYIRDYSYAISTPPTYQTQTIQTDIDNQGRIHIAALHTRDITAFLDSASQAKEKCIQLGKSVEYFLSHGYPSNVGSGDYTWQDVPVNELTYESLIFNDAYSCGAVQP